MLELVDEFEQNHNSSISTSSKILDESFLKVAAEKSTPTRMVKNAVNSCTPSAKVIPRKKTTLLIHRESKDERVKEEKKEPVMSKDVIKKKMRAIKIPEKYEKMLEGVLTDTLEAVDFTNA